MKINLTIGMTGDEVRAENWRLDHIPRAGEFIIYQGKQGTVRSVDHDYDAKIIYIRAW